MAHLETYLRKNAMFETLKGVAGDLAHPIKTAVAYATGDDEMNAQQARNARPFAIPLRQPGDPKNNFPSKEQFKAYNANATATMQAAQDAPWLEKATTGLGLGAPSAETTTAATAPWTKDIESRKGWTGEDSKQHAQGLQDVNKIYTGMYGTKANEGWNNVTGGVGDAMTAGKVIPKMTSEVGNIAKKTNTAVDTARWDAVKKWAPGLIGGVGALALGYGMYNRQQPQQQQAQQPYQPQSMKDKNWGGQ